MAGIGFVLRKLLDKKSVVRFATTHLHASLVACGPWLLIALFFIGPFEFQKLMLLNFSLAMVLTGPLVMIMTRYLADLAYENELESGSGMLFGALLLFSLIVFPVISFIINVQVATSVVIISGIWIASPYLSTLKNYWGVTLSFFLGASIAIASASEFGMVGYHAGLLFILVALMALVLLESSGESGISFYFLSYFSKYYELALSGLCFTLAIWFDKWIMWHYGVVHYSSDLFAAYLACVPIMALFVVSEETRFYEGYQKYFSDILAHATLEKIQHNFMEIKRNLNAIAKKMILFQSVICFSVLLLGSSITFRLGVLCASFQVLTIFMTIVLTYFDCRRQVLKMQLLFLTSNISLTLILVNVPGLGCLISSMLTFAYATKVTYQYTQKIPYNTFTAQI